MRQYTMWCVVLLASLCLAEQGNAHLPAGAARHRSELVRVSRAVWGLEAPISVFAAQIHTESWWRNDTVSSAGAEGLAQFLPSTAQWLPSVVPDLEREAGKPAPFNPGWALRALVSYDAWLWKRVCGESDLERMAFTLSAYNGGIGWITRDCREAARLGYCPERWFNQVERANSGRRASSFRENRRYVRLILLERQYLYLRAGWGPGIVDEDSAEGGRR